MVDRIADTIRFYQLLDRIEERSGGARLLVECTGRIGWPQRGVYFFFERGERRSRSGSGGRVVRVGTHGLKVGSRSTLWGRLAQHAGTRAGVGNHRGSIFRLLVGVALARRDGTSLPPSWGVGADRGTAAKRLGLEREGVKAAEHALEYAVSHYIGAMPFLWIDVGDEPGPACARATIERNAVALLSARASLASDPASTGWLGQYSDRERVKGSGLWNNNHVDEHYEPSFLDVLEKYVERSEAR